MALHSEEVVIPAKAVRSLAWEGSTLVDWVAGAARYELDGTKKSGGINWTYRFDAAVVSGSGALVAIYEKLGTKGLLIRTADQHLVRELNRSFYCADAYEYPIAFVTLPDGSEGLAHCPREYCRLDIELADTGRCLTDHPSRKPSDVFHSRLRPSPGGTWLASAGWVWHPFDVASLWDLRAVLDDPRLLDESQVGLKVDDEVAALAFLDDRRLVIGTGDENEEDEKRPHRLVVFDPIPSDNPRKLTLEKPAGTLHRLDENLVLSLFEHPTLIQISDGAVVGEWPHLATGKQRSSIIHHLEQIPPVAVHPTERMFAVASQDAITVVRVK